jgi:hypothetical protein
MTFMVKVNVDISKLRAEIISELKVRPTTLSEMADFWKDRIYAVTKTGKSIIDGSSLKKLSPSYVDFRRKYKGAKGELFGPNKSNLTLTGQMLESLHGTANFRTQSVSVNLIGTRDDGLKNSKLAEYVEEQGRPFLGLDQKGKERLKQFALRDIRRQLKNRVQRKKRAT